MGKLFWGRFIIGYSRQRVVANYWFSGSKSETSNHGLQLYLIKKLIHDTFNFCLNNFPVTLYYRNIYF